MTILTGNIFCKTIKGRERCEHSELLVARPHRFIAAAAMAGDCERQRCQHKQKPLPHEKLSARVYFVIPEILRFLRPDCKGNEARLPVSRNHPRETASEQC